MSSSGTFGIAMGDFRVLVTYGRARTCALGSRPRVVQENRRVCGCAVGIWLC